MLITAGFWTPGTGELVILLVIVLLLFGPKNLPKIGGAIGRSLREFKEGMKGITETEEEEDKVTRPMERKTPSRKPEILPPSGDSPEVEPVNESKEKQL